MEVRLHTDSDKMKEQLFGTDMNGYFYYGMKHTLIAKM